MSRLIDADAYIAYCEKNWIPLNIDAVNAQPTIEPDVARVIATIIENEKDMRVINKQRWIPCNWHKENENLPEECKSVLICVVDGNKCLIDVSYRTDYNRWERYGRINVVAWMPLPEPWKGSDSE